MGFLDDFADVIDNVSSEVKDRASEMKDTYALKREYRDTEKYLTARYIELGKKYYKRNKNRNKKELADITDALERLDWLQDKIDEIRGTVECDACGATNDKEAVYCNRCGAKLGEKTEEKAEENKEESTAEKVDAEVVEDDE